MTKYVKQVGDVRIELWRVGDHFRYVVSSLSSRKPLAAPVSMFAGSDHFAAEEAANAIALEIAEGQGIPRSALEGAPWRNESE
jgi:hypothetical protein